MTATTGWTAAALLGIAGAAIWVAALMPQFFAVWTGRGDRLAIIAAHARLWRVNATLFGASSALAVAGAAALLTEAMSHPLALGSVAVLAVAAALWIVHSCWRATLVVDAARYRTVETERMVAHTQPWLEAVWTGAAVLVILGFAGIGIVVLTTGIVGAWAGWLTLASAVFSLTLLIVTREEPPVVAYLPLVPLAAAAAIAAVGA